MRALPFTLFVIFSVALALMLLQQNAPKEVGQSPFKPLPVLHVTKLGGDETWNQEALKGQVTLINIFASWCVPCAAEMPELLQVKKQYPNLNIVGIAWNDKPEVLNKWLKKHGNPFHSIWVDKNGDAAIDLGIRGIPETLIVDGDGMVRFRFAGVITKDMREGELSIHLREAFEDTKHEK